MLFAKEFRRQLLATLSVNIIAISYGVSIGWSSASLVLLEHVDSPLPSGPLSHIESSWVGSFIGVGGFASNLLMGPLSGHFGRKTLLITAAFPQLMGWFLLYIAQNVYYLYIGRLMQGICGGILYTISPIFIAEIADNRIRGTLGSIFMLSANIGIVLAFVLGHYVDMSVIPLILMIITFLFLVAMFYQYETPQYLIRSGNDEAAEKSMRFYRNLSDESKEELGILQCELQLLKSNCNSVTAPENGKDHKDQNDSKITWRDFVTPAARKALTIGIFLLWLKQFSGISVINVYAGQLFNAAGSSITPNKAAIVIGVVQVFGTYISSLLVDRAGRKILLTISTVGTGLSFLTLAIYTSMIAKGYDLQFLGWIPMVSVSFGLFLSSCGILPMPFVVLSELLPPKIRSIGSSIGMSSLWGFGFLTVKFYPPLVMAIGVHSCLFIFAGCAFIGTIFVNTYMFETKGKSFEEIMRILEGRKKVVDEVV